MLPSPIRRVVVAAVVVRGVTALPTTGFGGAAMTSSAAVTSDTLP